ncbi:hypothetical protein KEM52_005837 [Ascosphaera acerosa]|nr:hypothetical protein KEM52_005837 [Ascosphaera acerosa]
MAPTKTYGEYPSSTAERHEVDRFVASDNDPEVTRTERDVDVLGDNDLAQDTTDDIVCFRHEQALLADWFRVEDSDDAVNTDNIIQTRTRGRKIDFTSDDQGVVEDEEQDSAYVPSS